VTGARDSTGGPPRPEGRMLGKRHARSSPAARALIAVATFAVLGLGAWSGFLLISRDTGTVAAPTATIPTPTTSVASAPAGTPSATTAPPTQAPAPTTEAPAPAPPAPPAPPPVDSGVEAFEQQVVTLVNAERASAGCSALTVDDRLATAARAHSADMAARDYFDHTTPEGVTFDQRIDDAGYSWSYAAENIAAGQSDPEAVMSSWMNSEGHRRNILDCQLHQIGVGLAYNGDDRPFWTQDFGTPR
jgi:uncharacterized protein YkwD